MYKINGAYGIMVPVDMKKHEHVLRLVEKPYFSMINGKLICQAGYVQYCEINSWSGLMLECNYVDKWA